MEKIGKKLKKLSLQDLDHKFDPMLKNFLINFKRMIIKQKVKNKGIPIKIMRIIMSSKYLSTKTLICFVAMIRIIH